MQPKADIRGKQLKEMAGWKTVKGKELLVDKNKVIGWKGVLDSHQAAKISKCVHAEYKIASGRQKIKVLPWLLKSLFIL